MNEIKMICFDMDGTIADLYGVENWLPMLREENPLPYQIAKPMWDMMEMRNLLLKIQQRGIEIRIITWLSMDSTEEYKAKTRQAKKEWLDKCGFPYDHFHGIAYGTRKTKPIKKYLAENKTAILFDDSEIVRNTWNVGATFNPQTENIIEILKSLI